MIAVIDNYDSFTYNLVQYLGELGADVMVYRNDVVEARDIETDKPSKLLISPGPCTPDKAGISLTAIDLFHKQIPILGIHHAGEGVFKGLADGYQATRYHSLVIDPASLPECLEVTAWTNEPPEVGGGRAIMGVRHRTLNIEGVQFHPESISSEHGHDLLRNFVQREL